MTKGVRSYLSAIDERNLMGRNPGDNRPGTGPGRGGDSGGDRHDAGTSGNRDNTPGQQGTEAKPNKPSKE
jgi:hypothetical protein